MNTFEFKKSVEFLLKEIETEKDPFKEKDTLVFKKSKAENGEEQIIIEISGSDFYKDDTVLVLSKEEAAALLELAKKYAGDRNSDITKTVNTEDKYSTQSTISIQKYRLDPLKMVLTRKQGSIYKGYESDASGYLVTDSGSVYQIIEQLPKYI